jgi:hypothetical protein
MNGQRKPPPSHTRDTPSRTGRATTARCRAVLMTISLPGRAAAMPRSENQRADKDTKYTGRWTSCKLLPHSLNGSELSTLRSGQRTAHVHTAIQRTSGWYNFSASVFPIVAAESVTRLHRIQRERAYARHTIVLQETLERAGNGDRAVHLRLPTGETCLAPRIQSDLYDRLWNCGRARAFPISASSRWGRWSRTSGRLRDRWTSRSSATPTQL